MTDMLFLTFSAFNPARGLLNRGKKTKKNGYIYESRQQEVFEGLVTYSSKVKRINRGYVTHYGIL